MTDDLEAKAREWLKSGAFACTAEGITMLLRSVAAEARKEALEEAREICVDVWRQNGSAAKCHNRLGALAGRKEGT